VSCQIGDRHAARRVRQSQHMEVRHAEQDQGSA
jgi:hypothetical protein